MDYLEFLLLYELLAQLDPRVLADDSWRRLMVRPASPRMGDRRESHARDTDIGNS